MSTKVFHRWDHLCKRCSFEETEVLELSCIQHGHCMATLAHFFTDHFAHSCGYETVVPWVFVFKKYLHFLHHWQAWDTLCNRYNITAVNNIAQCTHATPWALVDLQFQSQYSRITALFQIRLWADLRNWKSLSQNFKANFRKSQAGFMKLHQSVLPSHPTWAN